MRIINEILSDRRVNESNDETRDHKFEEEYPVPFILLDICWYNDMQNIGKFRFGNFIYPKYYVLLAIAKMSRRSVLLYFEYQRIILEYQTLVENRHSIRLISVRLLEMLLLYLSILYRITVYVKY